MLSYMQLIRCSWSSFGVRDRANVESRKKGLVKSVLRGLSCGMVFTVFYFILGIGSAIREKQIP